MTGTSARAIAVGAAVVTGMTALVATAVPAQAAPAATRAASPVMISGPATAKVGDKFAINCQAPARLKGGTVVVYQNGNIFPVKGVKVGATGACNFKVVSGIAGVNKFDVAIQKNGKYTQSNLIKVKVTGNTSFGAANTVKISGPKSVTQKGSNWARINITCQAPANTAGGKVVLYQNGAIFPVTNLKVAAGGVCTFWVKSGVIGVNTFDLVVQKSGKSYQSNAIKVNVINK